MGPVSTEGVRAHQGVVGQQQGEDQHQQRLETSASPEAAMGPPAPQQRHGNGSQNAAEEGRRRGEMQPPLRPPSRRIEQRADVKARRSASQQQQQGAAFSEGQHHDNDEEGSRGRPESLTNSDHMQLAEIGDYEYQEGGSDEDSRSSPARSSAALALASMFRQKSAPDEPVGYAFPLDDNVAQPKGRQKSKRSSSGGAMRRGSSSSTGSANFEQQPPSEDINHVARPRKKDRKSAPFSSPCSAEVAAVWGNQHQIVERHEVAADLFPSAVIAGPHGPHGVAPIAALNSRHGIQQLSAPLPSEAPAGTGGSKTPAILQPPSAGGRGSMGGHLSGSDESGDGSDCGNMQSVDPPPQQQFQSQYMQPQPPGASVYQRIGLPRARPQAPAPPAPPAAPAASGVAHGVAPGVTDVAAAEMASHYSTYNRKEKSLGLLCENFMKRFGDQPPDQGISLDRAAHVLGVERRRIYDIINILESVCYVSRQCKNTYYWHGQMYLSSTLKQLQDEALELWPGDARRNGLAVPKHHVPRGAAGAKVGTHWPIRVPGLSEPGQATLDDRKEKSLGRLSQKFIQLFLVGYQVISLAGAAEKLLGPTISNMTDKGMKTKVRRLYDIANVLTSLRLIDKVVVPESRKPSFRWVGIPAVIILHQPIPTLAPPGEAAKTTTTTATTAAGGSSSSGGHHDAASSPASGMTTGTDTSSSSSSSSPPFGEHHGIMHDHQQVGGLRKLLGNDEMPSYMRQQQPPSSLLGLPSSSTAAAAMTTSRMPSNPDEWQHWSGAPLAPPAPPMQQHHPHPAMNSRPLVLPHSATSLLPLKPPDRLAWAPDAAYLRGLGIDVDGGIGQQEGGGLGGEPEGTADGRVMTEPAAKRKKGGGGGKGGGPAMQQPTHTVQL